MTQYLGEINTNVMIYRKTCEQCGRQFTAQKSSTRFCSRKCTGAAYKEKVRQLNQNIFQSSFDNEKKTSDRIPEIMSPTQAANYLGVTSRTIYRYILDGTLPCLRTGGKTFISKSGIDSAFEKCPKPVARTPAVKEEKPSSPQLFNESEGYMTAVQVAQKYDLSLSGSDKILNHSGITQVKHKGKNYYPTKEVIAYFNKREAKKHPEITEWYTIEEVCEKYHLAQASVYSIVDKWQIPRKREKNKSYYSKIHFDLSRGDGSQAWYTVKQAMEKYGQTRDQVYNVLRYNGIQRVQQGRFVKFTRAEYDAAMKYAVLVNDDLEKPPEG